MEITWRVISGKGEGIIGKRYREQKHKWLVQNRQWEVKNSIGNRKAEELTCMTHGPELRWGQYEWEKDAGQRGIKGGGGNGTTAIA